MIDSVDSETDLPGFKFKVCQLLCELSKLPNFSVPLFPRL